MDFNHYISIIIYFVYQPKKPYLSKSQSQRAVVDKEVFKRIFYFLEYIPIFKYIFIQLFEISLKISFIR